MAKPSFKRNSPSKSIVKKILIACEGKYTEPLYFRAISRDLRLSTVKVIILPHDGTDPLSIVNKLLEERQDRKFEKTWLAGDSAWAVFDGDEHIQKDLNKWHQVVQMAKKENIKLAITNPSIEFWYLIHFQDNFSNISCSQAEKRLNQHIPNYDKSICYYPDRLKPKTQEAIVRATNLERNAKQNKLLEYANPCCSGISQLVQILLDLGNR
jgi:flavorubredoxin